MWTKSVGVALVVSLLYALYTPPGLAESLRQNTEQVRQQVEKIVAKSGVGEKARLTVRVQDRSEVKGYVAQISERDFVVRDRSTGLDKTIAYADVISIKGRGRSVASKIAIGAAIGGAAFLIGLAIAYHAGSY